MVEITHESRMIHVPVNDVSEEEYDDREGDVPDGISYDLAYAYDGDLYARTRLDDGRIVRMQYTDSGWEAEVVEDSSAEQQPDEVLWERGEREKKQ